jgi:AcrR family transcriptional regulator
VTSISQGTTRERLLRTAAELFHRDGVATVGVDRLCQAAGASKRSLYQLFATKDELVAESLRTFGAQDVAGYFEPAATDLSPRARILQVFQRLEERAAEPGFHGCPFVNTAIEMHDATHPASAVARDFKDRLTAYFEKQAELGHAREPKALAAQLTMVFDGSAVRAVMRAAGLDGLAVRAAATLVDAAGIEAEDKPGRRAPRRSAGA